eukprot:TRINITY_DN3224_c0_g1_i1.p1 TRINITY_DN3224_c0_g1~~TRINITY_DN3224_c0_g1_i1.p1  ORF type:complete len:406 (-),score=80.32 TRINITY_DN3224_c0_g1_i1:87-1304(-)
MPGHRDVAGLLKRHGYKELKKIGEGSFGKAILVQTEEGARLVNKMVDVSQASRKEADDAVKEGKLLSALKHPYIVRYRESFLEEGWLCILMDYCEGGDLSGQIEQAKRARQPIPEGQVLTWLTQALLALKFIHEKHILHRDLKSANFFLTRGGTTCKMGDFGIAKVLACTAACAKTQIGTPYYLSPEVCKEKPYAWASDIWAMGIILYELCERRVPFDAANIPGLVQKICNGPTPQITTGYSDNVRMLCGDMLHRDMNKRPSAEIILARPYIQDVVRRMLQDRQGGGDDARSEAPSAHPRGGSRQNSPSSRQVSGQSGSRAGSPAPGVNSALRRGNSQDAVGRGRTPSRGASPAPTGQARGLSPGAGPGAGPGVRPPGMPRAPSPGMARGPSKLANAGAMAVGGR